MQRVELLETVGQIQPLSGPIEIDPADYVTDDAEIRAMIRRAVTISWQDSIFSYDELAERLLRNGAVLPDTREERDDYFESVLSDLWHQRKELARAALQPQPTRVRYMIGEVEHHGIVVPNIAQPEMVAQPEAVDVVSAPVVELVSEAKEVTAPQKRATQHELTRVIFDELMSTAGADARLQYGDLATRMRNEYSETCMPLLRSVVKEMTDCGYITTYQTGKKRQQKTWLHMSAEAKRDVLDELTERSIDEMIEDVFGYGAKVS